MNEWHAAPSGHLQLEENEIDIWLFHLSTQPQRIKHYYALLSADEKERSEKFVNFIHRKRYITSHGFMRSILSQYLNSEPSELVFAKAENGKPYLQLNSNQPAIQFNLSHSHNMALLGVCLNHDIGVDIEYMDRKNNWQGLIKRFFTTNEQNNIFSLPEEQQRQAFFKTWTRKEAHMKVTGQGLKLAPGQFTVSTPPASAKLIAYTEQKTINVERWSMSDIETPEMAKDYCGCLSYEGNFKKLNYYIAM